MDLCSLMDRTCALGTSFDSGALQLPDVWGAIFFTSPLYYPNVALCVQHLAPRAPTLRYHTGTRPTKIAWTACEMEGGRKTTMKRELLKFISNTDPERKWNISQHNLENFQTKKKQWSRSKMINTSKLTLLSSALGPQIDVLVDGHFPRDVAKLSDATGWQCLSHLFSKVRIHGYKFHSFVWEARNYKWMQAASSLRQWLLQRGGQRLKKNSPKRWRESSAGTPEFWLDKEIHKNTQRTSLFHISVSDSATNGLQSDVGGWTTLRGSLIQIHAEMNVTKWKTDEKLKPWQVPLVLYKRQFSPYLMSDTQSCTCR